jgi:hypothetical protein
MSTEEEKNEMKEMRELMKQFIELEKLKLQSKIKEEKKKEQETPKEEPLLSKEEVKEELKEHDLGELIIYALRNNLIRKSGTPDKDKDE